MFKRKYILVTGLLLAMAASSSSWAAQYARPNSTVTAAGWTPVAAGTLHEALDEVSGNDTDYITSGNGNNSSVILGLSPIVDPGTYTSNHILRYRCQSSNGAKGPERCNVALYQGTTQIYVAPNASASVGAFSLQSFTIPDASAITDYSALRVHLISDALDAGESIEISWVELEVPDAVATTPPTVTSPTFADVTDTTATLGGNVTDNGGATVTSRGVEWGTTPGGPWPNSTSAAAGGTGIFTVPVTGLPAGTTMARLCFVGGAHSTSWDTFRFYGPTTSRFDHQLPDGKLVHNHCNSGSTDCDDAYVYRRN